MQDIHHRSPNYPYHIWRLARFLYMKGIPVLPFLLQQFSRVVFCCLIPYRTSIGKNVHFNHLGLGIILHPDCVIGDDVLIMQHVTVGENKGGCPIIGNNVFIGPGSKVLGGIRVGDNAKIGANAVVIRDVPANATAVGVPARIIERRSC